MLVYRLEGSLPSPEVLSREFEKSVDQWDRHSVAVSGIQLDFDSPTSKLCDYAIFLKSFKRLLPRECELSITGLGDWAINGDIEAMHDIAASADEIVFQLYQERRNYEDIDFYIKALKSIPVPFRIGLISGQVIPHSTYELNANRSFLGLVMFIQRRAHEHA